ncbi:DUF4129 domain-containing protein [Phenylobacterium sp. LjRoot164]|uniref:DUF4129 domain-containing protein n=1 Tax=unclassified Phenylobacterium TaxID=2640670 RepID=UPI003ECC83F7
MDAGAPVDKAGDPLAAAHAELLRDRGFQFDRADFQPPKTPEWFKWIAEAFQAIAPLLKWVFWIGVAVIAALVLYALVREVLRLRMPAAKPKTLATEAVPEWRPDVAAARDLLAAADALAAEGRYAEAAHLILLRSVADIESRRPRTVRPALTTREIAGLSALPPSARPAFAQIGRVVERSLFGGAPVQATDYAECRRDYEAFALPAGWA